MKWILLALVVFAVGCGSDTRKQGPGTEACGACGEFVSQKASVCPQCGEPFPTRTARTKRRLELTQEFTMIDIREPIKKDSPDYFDWQADRRDAKQALDDLPAFE